MNILLTGGAGYIGSHAAVSLLANGHNICILDNLTNSSKKVIQNLAIITKQEVPFVEGDILNKDLLIKILKDYNIDSVMHFAGLKSVSESVKNPLLYFKNNVQGTIVLLEAMERAEVSNLVFSGSATVYGDPQYLPIDENHPLNAMNPYGRSKQQIEEILRDVAYANESWNIVSLRYFNPIGAHPSGLIGEKYDGIPNNLMPIMCKVALGQLKHLNVFGDNYKTSDGTGIRDYIDIMDLVEGHIAALEFIKKGESKFLNDQDRGLKNFHSFNLGTGKGYSVLELIHTFEKVSGVSISYKFLDRRLGDIAECYADYTKAKNILGWTPKRSLEDMCQGTWDFIKNKNLDYS